MHGSDCESSRAARTGACPRGRRPHVAVIAVAAAVLTTVAVVGCQGHASPAAPGSVTHSPTSNGVAYSHAPGSAAPPSLVWSAARAPLPPDTDRVRGQYAVLEDVSCPAVGHCVAVGYDKASSASGDVYQGLVETLSDGTWTPTAVPGVFSRNSPPSLGSVSCPVLGTCVAVGFVESPAGVSTPVIERLSGSRWVPVRPPLPGDSSGTASALLTDVSCPAAGTCVATGWYITRSGYRWSYIDTLSGGTWTAASAPLPGDAVQQKGSSRASTYLAAVACTGVGACVASGQYQDANGGTRPVIDTLSRGSWTAMTPPLPGDAAAAGQTAGLWAIGCPVPGTCLAGGHYQNRGGQPRYLIDTLSGGSWTASVLSLPANAAADQKWSQDEATSVGGLACASASYCVATAGYLAKSGEIMPLIEALSGGTWTAVTVPLPVDAVTGSGPGNSAFLELATCPAVGSCLTVGSYPAADGTAAALIETATPGTP